MVHSMKVVGLNPPAGLSVWAPESSNMQVRL